MATLSDEHLEKLLKAEKTAESFEKWWSGASVEEKSKLNTHLICQMRFHAKYYISINAFNSNITHPNAEPKVQINDKNICRVSLFVHKTLTDRAVIGNAIKNDNLRALKHEMHTLDPTIVNDNQFWPAVFLSSAVFSGFFLLSMPAIEPEFIGNLHPILLIILCSVLTVLFVGSLLALVNSTPPAKFSSWVHDMVREIESNPNLEHSNGPRY